MHEGFCEPVAPLGGNKTSKQTGGDLFSNIFLLLATLYLFTRFKNDCFCLFIYLFQYIFDVFTSDIRVKAPSVRRRAMSSSLMDSVVIIEMWEAIVSLVGSL